MLNSSKSFSCSPCPMQKLSPLLTRTHPVFNDGIVCSISFFALCGSFTTSSKRKTLLSHSNIVLLNQSFTLRSTMDALNKLQLLFPWTIALAETWLSAWTGDGCFVHVELITHLRCITWNCASAAAWTCPWSHEDSRSTRTSYDRRWASLSCTWEH